MQTLIHSLMRTKKMAADQRRSTPIKKAVSIRAHPRSSAAGKVFWVLATAASLISTSTLFAADASRRAPGFSLPDVQTEQHDLADYRGKVVILEFMQTTCPHCAAFTEVLSQVQQKYGDRVAIISVVNPPDDQPRVRPYIAAHRITWPVVFDCGQVAYSYLRAPSFDIPHVFLIDTNGEIREDFGYTPATRDIFEGKGIFSHLDALLKK
jgi:thiol-disulfide isomerase/thioredoxin